MTDCAHFPVQDPNDSGLCRMEDHVIDLVVAVQERSSVFRLCVFIAEELHQFFMMWDMAYGLLGVDVLRGGLRFAEDPEEMDLAVVEATRFSVAGHVYGGRVEAVEFGESTDCIVPPAGCVSRPLALQLDRSSLHLGPLLWADIRYRWILKYPPCQILHDIKWCADDAIIIGETVRLRYRDIGIL